MSAAATPQQAQSAGGDQAQRRRFGNRRHAGRPGHARRAAWSGGERSALDPHVEIDDAVVVDVDLPVVVEVSVGPAGDAQAHVEVYFAVIVDVDLAVEV